VCSMDGLERFSSQQTRKMEEKTERSRSGSRNDNGNWPGRLRNFSRAQPTRFFGPFSFSSLFAFSFFMFSSCPFMPLLLPLLLLLLLLLLWSSVLFFFVSLLFHSLLFHFLLFHFLSFFSFSRSVCLSLSLCLFLCLLLPPPTLLSLPHSRLLASLFPARTLPYVPPGSDSAS